jgi:OPA family glycerol-3-phosphate transporter-like MFS transporter
VDAFGWDGGFILLVGGCIMAIVLIGMTVQQEIDHKSKA